ncbi:unnamed protein product [Symbiodinium natans]|uniref:Uncharacterized protein n=1 Tax=Symbiodinium natans TaxID=878477 RepID=A0A812IAA1_9DINO|nr:unnamed protein product [Symbiodinium natans]
MELVGGEFCFQFRGLVLSNSAGPSDRGRPAEQSPPQASAGQLHHTSLFRSQQISSLVWSIRTLRKLLKGVLQFMFTLLCHRHLLVHHAGSQLLKGLSGAPLATVDEGQEREATPPPANLPKPAEEEQEEEPQEVSQSLEGYPSQTTVSSKAHPAHHSSQSTNAQPSRQRPPVQPVQARPLMPHEREALYTGLSQAPSGSLAFGRCLQGRRPTPQGSPVFSPQGPRFQIFTCLDVGNGMGVLCRARQKWISWRLLQRHSHSKTEPSTGDATGTDRQPSPSFPLGLPTQHGGRGCVAELQEVIGLASLARRFAAGVRPNRFILLSTAIRSFEAGVVASMMPSIRAGLHLTYTSQGNVAGAPDYGIVPSGLLAMAVFRRFTAFSEGGVTDLQNICAWTVQPLAFRLRSPNKL